VGHFHFKVGTFHSLSKGIPFYSSHLPIFSANTCKNAAIIKDIRSKSADDGSSYRFTGTQKISEDFFVVVKGLKSSQAPVKHGYFQICPLQPNLELRLSALPRLTSTPKYFGEIIRFFYS